MGVEGRWRSLPAGVRVCFLGLLKVQVRNVNRITEILTNCTTAIFFDFSVLEEIVRFQGEKLSLSLSLALSLSPLIVESYKLNRANEQWVGLQFSRDIYRCMSLSFGWALYVLFFMMAWRVFNLKLWNCMSEYSHKFLILRQLLRLQGSVDNMFKDVGY